MNKWKFLDSDALKIIAIATMLIDHIGAALIETAFLQGGAGISYHWYEIDAVLRSIGRTAFPIFVFLLVEGFFHTHSRTKYFTRLALFSLLSEVSFDLAFHGELFYRDSQNVFWTLSIGFLVIWGMEYAYERCMSGRGSTEKSVSIGRDMSVNGTRARNAVRGCVWLVCAVLLVFAGVFAAEFLCTDYGGHGVLLAVLFYLGKRFCVPRLFVCTGGYFLFLWEPQCIIGFLLILFYNGARKKRGKGFQYFFYLFYPVHLLILGMLRVVFFAR